MITLVVDASTYVGDVALMDGTVVLAEESTAMKDANCERLMPAVAALFERTGKRVADLDRVVCGAGPGSFTSLRIAGGIAKGIATGANLPLYAVPSMALIVGATSLTVGQYLVAVDALRSEFYVGLYHVSASGEVLEVERAKLVSAADVEAVAMAHHARIVSPTEFPDGVVASPRARAVARMAHYIESSRPVDVTTWEPAYGRLAEAQVKWEATHGRPLSVG
jgi:tRNA threonylcarbamoyl adenosine modification protein YeaZ